LKLTECGYDLLEIEEAMHEPAGKQLETEMEKTSCSFGDFYHLRVAG